ncbi:uncharacterized protein LOC106636267 [Copidosoma floridanum]|uniref:uncharacterized protein LOC106636267 n=1 Tax=Copidosoma floridanum TaxID=29053 RepID=UPI0006C9574A|nr:uncharacterized protein LOC106636267 [Copidosoma floridanum]XP_014204105.1 uncharacterized protein LOC106636267 [Copidosoma floridanum]XP_014204106.1 uncharacterized protein LOC106636267 [Copidosoma floridanum]
MRRIFAFHVLLNLLLVFNAVNCQFEDDALVGPVDNNTAHDYPSEGVESEYRNKVVVVQSRGLFSEDSQRPIPTFVSPVEKIMLTLIKPLKWIGWLNGAIGTHKNSSKFNNQLIGELTKPIKVAGKSIRGTFGQVLNLIGSKFKAIFPGTEWCGAGNISSSIDEVGLFKKTDSCCRDHDLCNINMAAGQTQHGLLNTGTFTRSHCSCDTKFYQCLKKVRSLVSKNIGYTYFNVLRPQCFKEDYPATCVKYGKKRIKDNKCLEYKYDNARNMTWQWFDNPDFF